MSYKISASHNGNESMTSDHTQTSSPPNPTQTTRRVYQPPQLKFLNDIQPQTGTTYPVAENTGGMLS